ncbi:hypothetical protein JCM10908_007018 [Rhodotorula pacifica]|uniref:glycosyltransferase n=1 Tax=Rhodotorula pacifica TaxID=1495444 RepID=UPI003176A526
MPLQSVALWNSSRRRRIVPPVLVLFLVFAWTWVPQRIAGRHRSASFGEWLPSPIGGRGQSTLFATRLGASAARPAAAFRSNPDYSPVGRLPGRKRKISAPFELSQDPLPVHHIHEQIHFHNTPLSPHRPAPNQFLRASHGLTYKQGGPPPIISITTPTHNPRDVLLETAASLFGQSLQNFEWVIVDDHSTDPHSLALLERVAQDPRVTLIRNTGTAGVTESRNFALNFVVSPERQLTGTVPKYIANLDDDDMFEFTALEKIVWMLESNPEWDLGGFYTIRFGRTNETVLTGLHSGAANIFSGNFVPNSAVYTSRAVISSGCGYDIKFIDGGEDWDFWLCLAEHGHWGGTVPEPLYWYRGNPAAFRKDRWGATFEDGFAPLKAHIDKKHELLIKNGGFPDIPPRPSKQLDTIRWDAPFENHLAHVEKSIMFIVPWLYIGGADIGALHQIQVYAERGYRVTVVCTLYRAPAGLELRPRVMQYTHDIHVVPSYLNAADIPRYIKYLLNSRGIDTVVLSNAQLAYELLPALTEQVPHVKFIDYLHNEAYDGWKSGGYPQYSLLSQRYLSRSITCSHYLRNWLIERGHANAQAIGVVKLGIEVSDFTPVEEADRVIAKKNLLGVGPDTVVITIVGRLDPQKRPDLVPDIAAELRRLEKTDRPSFLIVMLGDGDLKDKVQARIAELRVHKDVRLLGTIERPQEYLAATDIFLLPSMSEGISIAVAEAMAMALPVVTAEAGALPEQLGFTAGDPTLEAGILIKHKLERAHDAPLYAQALHKLVKTPTLRRDLGLQGRRNVEKTFDWHETLQGMFDEVQQARLPDPRAAARLPHPAAHYAIQNVLLEAHDETDFAAVQTRLKAPLRSGMGRILQERCGESSESITRWIDGLESPTKCDWAEIKAPLSSNKLQRSAKFQCASWCVFDLTRPDYGGWAFSGECWTPFDDTVPLHCKEFWHARPAGINLPK